MLGVCECRPAVARAWYRYWLALWRCNAAACRPYTLPDHVGGVTSSTAGYRVLGLSGRTKVCVSFSSTRFRSRQGLAFAPVSRVRVRGTCCSEHKRSFCEAALWYVGSVRVPASGRTRLV